MKFSLTELHAAGSTAAYVARSREIASLIQASASGIVEESQDLSRADDEVLCSVVKESILDPKTARAAIQNLALSGGWLQITEKYRLAERLGNECDLYLPALQEHQYKSCETTPLGECHRFKRVDNPYNTSARVYRLSRGILFPTGIDFMKKHYSKEIDPNGPVLFHFPYLKGSNRKMFFGDRGQLQYLQVINDSPDFQAFLKAFGNANEVTFKNPALHVADCGNTFVDFELSLLDAGFPHADVTYRISRALIDSEHLPNDPHARLVMLSRHPHWISHYHAEGPGSRYVFLSAALEAFPTATTTLERPSLATLITEDSKPLCAIGSDAFLQVHIAPATGTRKEPQVLTVESLTKDPLNRLADGDVLAIMMHCYDKSTANKIGKWINRYTARKMTEQMLASSGRQGEKPRKVYQDALRYHRMLGTTRYSLATKRWQQSLYCNALDRAAVDNTALREFAGEKDPSVVLINSLRQAHSPGADFLTPEDREMIYGSGGTVFPPISQASPHVDLPFSDDTLLISAIFYFILPNEGAGLKIWPENDVYFLSADEQQARPATLLQPSPGDLILFSPSQRVHAVMNFMEGFRVSTRIFIEFERDKPLQLYN